MDNQFRRRAFIKKGLQFIISAITLHIGASFYGRYLEPTWTQITNYIIPHKNIPKGFSGLKIVQFSDTHLGFQYTLKQLKKTITRINALHPDIIVFTGDLMDKPNEFNQKEAVSAALSHLQAPLGKICIYGNHDHGGYGTTAYEEIMKNSGFTILKNTNMVVKNAEQQPIFIAGIDDAMLGKPNWDQTMQNIPHDSFCILLSHAPDFADRASTYPISLQLSGHSHGGQVQIPFLGALATPPYAKKYYEGMYHISSLQLYVNRGLGTTRIPIRFFARPELTLFTLQATSE
ncbi:MAG: metallophosphoesterase [Bacillus sp. (in: firmicutes)]